MATDLEVWWSDNYEKVSLANLETLDIYSKFQSLHEPFYRQEDDSHYESFHASSKSRQYTLTSGNSGEKLTFYHSSNTWKYEKWTYTPDLALTWKTWKNGYAEWGLIANGYPDRLVKESWKREGGQRVFETFTITGKETIGIRSGINEKEGKSPETWTEKSLETSSEFRLERTWTGHNGRGSEIRGCVGTRHYGEVTLQTSNCSEKKRWTLEGDCEKGTCSGETQADGKFMHKWHRDGTSVKDEHIRKPVATDGERPKVEFQAANGNADALFESQEKVVSLEAEVQQLKALNEVNRTWMKERMAKVAAVHLGKSGAVAVREIFALWREESVTQMKSPVSSPASPPQAVPEETKLSPTSPRSPQQPVEEGKEEMPEVQIQIEPATPPEAEEVKDASPGGKKGGAALKKAGAAAAKKSGPTTPVATQPSGANTPNPKKAGTPTATAKKAGATVPAKKAGAKK